LHIGQRRSSGGGSSSADFVGNIDGGGAGGKTPFS